MSKNGQTPDTATDSEPDMIHPNEYKRRWFVWATAKAQKLAAEGFGLGKIMESLHLSGYEWWEIKRVGGIKIKKCPCGSVSARWAGIDWTQRDVDIAKQFGVTQERIRQIRNARGEPKAAMHNKSGKETKAQEIIKVNRDVLSGLSFDEGRLRLPELFSLAGRETIKRWLNNAGVKLRLERHTPKTLAELEAVCVKVNASHVDGLCWKPKSGLNFGNDVLGSPRVNLGKE